MEMKDLLSKVEVTFKLKDVLTIVGCTVILGAISANNIVKSASLNSENEKLKKETRILTDLNFMLARELRSKKGD